MRLTEGLKALKVLKIKRGGDLWITVLAITFSLCICPRFLGLAIKKGGYRRVIFYAQEVEVAVWSS